MCCEGLKLHGERRWSRFTQLPGRRREAVVGRVRLGRTGRGRDLCGRSRGEGGCFRAVREQEMAKFEARVTSLYSPGVSESIN